MTDLGVAQARSVGGIVRTLVTGTVTLWSSPLGRALRTAEIIRKVADLGCAPKLDGRLREISLGSWDGLTDQDIEAVSPGACDGATRFDWFFRSPDGETFEQADGRLRDWLAEVGKAPGCHVVVSHGLSGRILRGAYLGLSRNETLRLDVSQSAVFKLSGGTAERLGADL